MLVLQLVIGGLQVSKITKYTTILPNSSYPQTFHVSSMCYITSLKAGFKPPIDVDCLKANSIQMSVNMHSV